MWGFHRFVFGQRPVIDEVALCNFVRVFYPDTYFYGILDDVPSIIAEPLVITPTSSRTSEIPLPSLLSLPLEIRFAIYELLLCGVSLAGMASEIRAFDFRQLRLSSYSLQAIILLVQRITGCMREKETQQTAQDNICFLSRHLPSNVSPFRSFYAWYLRQLWWIQSYIEATQVLYGRNTFLMQTELLLRHLNPSLPQHHFALLRSIELLQEYSAGFHEPPNSAETRYSYRYIWEHFPLESLPGLRRLRVIILVRGRDVYRGEKDFSHAWLDPVVKLASKKTVDFLELAVPRNYLEAFDQEVIKSRKFNIRRMRERTTKASDLPWHADCPSSFQSFAPGEEMHEACCGGGCAASPIIYVVVFEEESEEEAPRNFERDPEERPLREPEEEIWEGSEDESQEGSEVAPEVTPEAVPEAVSSTDLQEQSEEMLPGTGELKEPSEPDEAEEKASSATTTVD